MAGRTGPPGAGSHARWSGARGARYPRGPDLSIVAAALVPAAPSLLREISGPGADDLTGVRDACGRALRDLATARPERLVIAARREVGTLSGFGAPIAPWPGLPLAAGWPHELGARLLSAAGLVAGLEVSVVPDLPSDATALAAALGVTDSRTVVLVLADGSTTRGPRAPGGEDPLGAVFDTEIGHALQSGCVLGLDQDMARALGCRGLGGIALFTALPVAGTGPDPAAYEAELRYEEAPIGVGYFVAVRPGRP